MSLQYIPAGLMMILDTGVDKEVIVEYKLSETETILDSGYYAWVAIYKKQAKGWKLDCVASTNRQGRYQ